MAAKQTLMIKGDVVGHKSYGFSQTIDAQIFENLLVSFFCHFLIWKESKKFE